MNTAALALVTLALVSSTRQERRAAAPVEYALTVALEPGRVVARTFESQLALEPYTSHYHVDGRAYDIDNAKRRMSSCSVLGWTDAIVELEAGHLTGLRRTFTSIEGTVHLADEGEPLEESPWKGPLVGAAVDFERLDQARPWSAKFAERQPEGSPALVLDAALVLPPLAVRDFGALLLPPEPVREGAQWDVAPEALAALLAPVGDVAATTYLRRLLVIGGLSGFTAPIVPPDLSTWLGAADDEYEGTIEARLEGQVAPSTGVLRIALDIDAKVTCDRASWASALLPDSVEMEVETYALAFELEGTALLEFDTSTGIFTSIEVAGDVGTSLEIRWSQTSVAGVTDLHAQQQHEGTLSVRRTESIEEP